MDEKQLETLVDTAVREAVDRTTKALTEKFEQQTKGLRENRDRLLAEKKSAKLDAVVDRYLKTGNWDHVQGGNPTSGPGGEIVFQRGAPHAEYRRLKEQAEKAGVLFRVVDYGDESPGPTPSKVKYVETDSVLYVNREQQRRLGVQSLLEMAQQKGKKLIAFRHVDDLPPEAQAKHARIVDAGDPDAFVFEGGDQ